MLPSRESLRADLRVLREAGLTGIVTYGVAIPAIPEIAHDLGFHAVLLGIWDPFGVWVLVLEPCVCIVGFPILAKQIVETKVKLRLPQRSFDLLVRNELPAFDLLSRQSSRVRLRPRP
jgi:hypothetical protein